MALGHFVVSLNARPDARLHVGYTSSDTVIAVMQPAVVVPQRSGALWHDLKHALGAAMPCLGSGGLTVKPTLQPRQR